MRPIVALLALAVIACSNGTSPKPPAATQIVITPGSPPALKSGATLQLSAQVLDASGKSVSDQDVAWHSSDPTKATVSPSGNVSGLKVGATTITATQSGLTSNSVQVTVIVGAPTKLTRAPDVPANLVAGTVIDSIGVTVTDAGGNKVPNAAITFTPTSGSGSVSPTTVMTDAQGHAATEWRASHVAAQHQVTATAANSNASTTFTTTITPGAVAGVRLISARTAVVDSGSTVTPTFSGADQYGNPIANVPLTYTTRDGTIASVNGSGVVTGVAHGQAMIVATAVANASYTDSALALVGEANQPAVYTDLPAFALKADTAIVVTVIADMRNSGANLGSAQVTVTWDPTVLTYVSDADGSSGVGATVNNTNAASGSLDIAMASANGFSGAVQLRRITFHAAASAGQTGMLAPSVVELAAATSFNVLTTFTVAASYSINTR
jgi:adhesin/invasin